MRIQAVLASFAMLAVAALTTGASAMSAPHYRASHQNGGMHYRASHGHNHHSKVVFSSACRGPVVVTTWQPSHRLYRSGFGHFSRPTIVAQPGIHTSHGKHGKFIGFVNGRSVFAHDPVCGYNGSVGSNLAHQRRIDWDKRAQVHSPKLSKSSD
jgi:hypothetical protein